MVQARIDIPLVAIEAICRRYHVRELAVFGSVLRGDFRADSDVDFLVEFNPDAPVGLIEFYRMQDELSDAVRRPVDLVPKEGLKRRIRDRVLSTAQVVYAA